MERKGEEEGRIVINFIKELAILLDILLVLDVRAHTKLGVWHVKFA